MSSKRQVQNNPDQTMPNVCANVQWLEQKVKSSIPFFAYKFLRVKQNMPLYSPMETKKLSLEL